MLGLDIFKFQNIVIMSKIMNSLILLYNFHWYTWMKIKEEVLFIRIDRSGIDSAQMAL